MQAAVVECPSPWATLTKSLFVALMPTGSQPPNSSDECFRALFTQIDVLTDKGGTSTMTARTFIRSLEMALFDSANMIIAQIM